MTKNKTTSMVLAPRQDVTDRIHSVRESLAEALIQICNSSVLLDKKYLVEIPRCLVLDANNACRHCANTVCEEWQVDEGFIRQCLLSSDGEDLDAASAYANDVVLLGPLGLFCLWNDGDSCEKGDSE